VKAEEELQKFFNLFILILYMNNKFGIDYYYFFKKPKKKRKMIKIECRKNKELVC